MAQFPRFRQRFLVAGLAAILLASGAGLSSLSFVLAEQTLTSADQPLQLKLTTSLDAKTAHYGDHFEGVLTDSYQMSGKSLPAGTLFKGRVQRAHKSMPFGMPGYVVLEIDEAQLPSGTVHEFDHHGVKSAKIVNPAAKTGKKLFKDNLPYTIISTATSIPLQYATGLSAGVILPITLGSRVALGIAMQMAHKKQPAPATAQNQPANQSLSSAVGQGVVQGSGLNSAYYFLTSAPEPVLTEGTVIPLHFRSHDLAGLFSAGESTTATENQTQPRAQNPVGHPAGHTSSSLVEPVMPQQAGPAVETSVEANVMARPAK